MTTTLRFCKDVDASDVAFALTALTHSGVRDFASQLYLALRRESPARAAAFLTSFREAYVDSGDAPTLPTNAAADGDSNG